VSRPAVIGLIGGMSWESSAEYYRIINREMQKRLGGVHSARSLMWSVDFGEIESLQHIGDWDKLTEHMVDAAIRLERGGADFVLMWALGRAGRRYAGVIGANARSTAAIAWSVVVSKSGTALS